MLKPLTMLVFLLVFAVAVLSLTFGLPQLAADWSQPVHAACTDLAPTSAHTLAYKAIVCGTSVARSPLRNAWSKTGLLHLLVVSGSHLIFLEAAFRRLLAQPLGRLRRSATPLIFFALTLFTVANLCQAPVLRALLALGLAAANHRFQLQWSKVHQLTIAGLLACAFVTDSHVALSLVMSWTASLAVSGFPRSDSSLTSHLKVYLLLAPALLPLSLPHPVSILCNLILGPFLGGVLFPASLACFFIPPLTPVVDAIWSATEWTLQAVAREMAPGYAKTPLPLAMLGLYLFCLTLIGYQTQRRPTLSQRVPA